MTPTLYPFNLRSGNGVQLTIVAEDEWEASKNFRQLTRQGYLKRGRFAKSMKPLYFTGYIQVKPGIPLEEYASSTDKCEICDEAMTKLDPDFLNATLHHCAECKITFISRREVADA